MTRHALIEFREVQKGFGRKHVLQDITLNIQPGEVFGIIGVSGAGKTTLLELLIGFLEPDKGDILYRSSDVLMGEDQQNYISVREEPQRVKRRFGFAMQEPSFYNELTVEENLRYFAALYNLSQKVITQNIETSLRLVGLVENKQDVAENLSGGMQKRLDIACAMIHNPQVLILDEPTADLDILLRRQMWELVKKINQRGTTVIIASHFLDEIEHLCDRIGILHQGAIVKRGKLEDLQSMYADHEEILLHTRTGEYGPILKEVKKKAKISKVIEGEGYIKMYTSDTKKVVQEIMRVVNKRKDNIETLKVEKPSLNEVFERITEQ